MRPFAIDAAARDAWLVRMRAALADGRAAGRRRRPSWTRYLEMAAEAMRNRG